MSWWWQFEAADGTALPGGAGQRFPTQADAETWLGESWRTLREQGVATVRLFEAEREVYGPMPLSEG